VDLDTDALHCGECGNACSPKQAIAACVEGACAIESCEDGFVDCNGQPADGCEVEDAGLPTRPRLLAPAIGAHTGSAFAEASLMPTLRWLSAAEGSCGEVTYQVQLDDSCIPDDAECAFDSPELDEAGITELVWRPTTPLPVSTEVPVGTQYFWRVRACEAGERCSDWSEARYLNVGRLRDDFNGDGFSDIFAISQDGENDQHIHIVPGQAPPAAGEPAAGPQRPAVNLISPIDSFGSVRYLGDVNGDGFGDGIRSTTTGAELVLGAADLTAVVQVPLPGAFSGTHGVAGIGDWNGDGYADFATSESVIYETPASVVHVYAGNAEAVFDSPLDINPPDGTTVAAFGTALEGGFDFNGDGYTDLFILDGDDGRVHFVAGGSEPDGKIGASLATGVPCPYYLRPTFTHAGDMNDDGYAELAMHCGLKVMIFEGARTPELTPVWTHSLSTAAQTLGHDVIGGYDFGTDGFSDLVMIGDTSSGTNLFIVPGSATLASTGAPVAFTGKLDEDGLLRSDMGLTAGDYDGDGRADLVVQVYGVGELRVFAGGRTISGGSCASNPAAAMLAGDWCRAAVRIIEGRYETQYNPNYQIGGSFGFLLGR
jgi:hypothetical protein